MSVITPAVRNKPGVSTPTKAFSQKQEKAVAQAVQGQRTKASGATAFEKSDVAIAGLMNLECKTKTSHSDSITIKKAWLEKTKEEAVFMGRPYSALAFSFGPGEENYYIIDEDLFLQLLETLQGDSRE